MTPLRPAWRESALFVALLSLLWLAATAWARPLMLPDEGRYVGVAWEMLRSGDWLTPTLNGLPYFHKPPLFYWITAASLAAFGPSAMAARAAPLLGAWLAAMALYLFARRWWGERAARAALLVLLVQPLFYIGGQFANLDMLVAGCVTATTLLLAHAALCVEQGLSHRRALAAAAATAALGVLAKGLIGAVIPAGVIVAWLLARRRARVLAALWWWPAAALFLLLAVPWFVLMQQRFDGFFDYFFVVQHFKRFAQGGFNNVQPFWFYPAVLLAFSLPWWPWLASLARRGPKHAARDPVRLLIVIWLAVVLLFFSLPQSKLIGYVLPALAPLALLIADGFVSAETASARLWRGGAVLAAAVSLGGVAAFALHPLHSSRGIAQTLAAQRDGRAPVYMLGTYAFDLPFYARLSAPVTVVDDWSEAQTTQRDNWRKELADAARFAPGAADSTLITPAALPAALCRAAVNWIVGSDLDAARMPVLAGAAPIARQGAIALWRLDRASTGSLNCAETPNDDPADR